MKIVIETHQSIQRNTLAVVRACFINVKLNAFLTEVSDPHLNVDENVSTTTLQSNRNNSTSNLNGRKQCSCGVLSLQNELIKNSNFVEVMTSRFALPGDIFQANLSIQPTCQNSLMPRTLSHHSVSTLPEPKVKWDQHKQFHSNNGFILQTSHSKSLDQLEVVVPMTSSSEHAQINNRKNVAHSAKQLNTDMISTNDLLTNINEFREKYKNPGGSINHLNLANNGVVAALSHQPNISTLEITTKRTKDKLSKNINASLNTNNKHELSTLTSQSCYNTLPRNGEVGLRNSYPPLRGKKRNSVNKQHCDLVSSNNTFPRSKSAHNIHRDTLELSRTRLNEQKHRSSNGHLISNSSSSESELAKPTNRKYVKMLPLSNSVPFKLENFDSNIKSFRNGLPQPPPQFVASPNSSESSLSDHSGWVSSRRSSGLASSPETLKDEQQTMFNGEQLRLKLLKLLNEQTCRDESASKGSNRNGNVRPVTEEQPTFHKKISSVTVRLKPSTLPARNMKDEWIETPPVQNSIHPYINKEIYRYSKMQQVNRAIESKQWKSLEQPEKSKSEFDLTHISDEFQLPPPQQFRDAPLPPYEFRDTPVDTRDSLLKSKTTYGSTSQKSISTDIGAIDNPLYHVYEALNKERHVIKCKSSNDLTLSTSEDDKFERNRKPKRRSIRNFRKNIIDEPPLLEFEKCREEFRKQIKYAGQIYSYFNKFASEVPYFQISNEYRSFSANGMHLIICVHGLDGNSADLRLVRTYLELGLPGMHLEFLMSERNQGETSFSDFDTMTDR